VQLIVHCSNSTDPIERYTEAVNGRVRTKRAYDPATADDGVRVLVDRYWPRGVQRETAQVDLWTQELAPSPELVAWFGHRPERWEEFKVRYWEELAAADRVGPLESIRPHVSAGELTLLYGARDRAHNNARALAEYLEGTTAPQIGAPARARTRARRETRLPAVRPIQVLQWPLLILALFSPLLGLFAVYIAAMYGTRRWTVLGLGLLLVAALTVFRVARFERQDWERSGIHAVPSEGESWWAIPRSLAAFAAGPIIGIAGLALLVVALAWATHGR